MLCLIFQTFLSLFGFDIEPASKSPQQKQNKTPPPPETHMQGRKQRIDLHPHRHAPPFKPSSASSSSRPQTHATEKNNIW